MAPFIAVLWDEEVDWEGAKPFSIGHVNTTYEFFSDIAQDLGAEVVIGKFSWYTEGGLEKAYQYNGESWEKNKDVSIDVVFDKYKFDEESVPVKKQIAEDLEVVNHFSLEEIAKDKLLTYREFPDLVSETREADRDTVSEFIEDDGKAVVKPRYAFGGKGVQVIDDVSEYEDGEDLLVQRFVDSSSGIDSLDINGVHDLRIVVVNGDPKASYARTPDSGFISNVSQGGSMHHIELEKLPEAAHEVVEEIDERFQEFGDRVYGVDMVFDGNGDAHVIEINSKPGLTFYEDEEVKEWKAPYIREVVETLVEKF